MPSLPNPETTMTLAGVGMVRDSSFSSSFFFFPLSFSFRIFRSIFDESSLKQFVFLDPYMPPNLGGGGRAPTTTKKKKKERERAKRDRARSFTREVLLDRFLKREDAAGARSRCFSIDFCFLFLFATVTVATKKRGGTKKRREKELLPDLCSSLSFFRTLPNNNDNDNNSATTARKCSSPRNGRTISTTRKARLRPRRSGKRGWAKLWSVKASRLCFREKSRRSNKCKASLWRGPPRCRSWPCKRTTSSRSSWS